MIYVVTILQGKELHTYRLGFSSRDLAENAVSKLKTEERRFKARNSPPEPSYVWEYIDPARPVRYYISWLNKADETYYI